MSKSPLSKTLARNPYEFFRQGLVIMENGHLPLSHMMLNTVAARLYSANQQTSDTLRMSCIGFKKPPFLMLFAFGPANSGHKIMKKLNYSFFYYYERVISKATA